MYEQAYVDIARGLKTPGYKDSKADLYKIVARRLDEELDST